MDSILGSSLAGAIAAVTATVILGMAKLIYKWIVRNHDIVHLRTIFDLGRERIMKDEDVYNKNMNTILKADFLRAAQYNNMIKILEVNLEKWMLHLSHNQRKDVLDALDWYHTDNLQVVKNSQSGNLQHIELKDGRWPTSDMPLAEAEKRFAKLQSLRWLNLKSLN